MEDFFREVNDRILELGTKLGLREEAVLELICECDDRTCTKRVSISADAYDEVRAAAGRHLVAAGHERAGTVVGRGEGYVVVAD